MQNEIKNKFKRLYLLMILTLFFPVITYAEESSFLDTPNGLFKSAGGTQTKNLLMALVSIITYVGPVVLLIGIVVFLIAKATDKLATQVTGLLMSIIGIIMVCAKTIMSAIVQADGLKDMVKIMIN